MDRDKLIERLKKLLAMSQDTSSPVEAEIAARRMQALMDKFDVSFAEIANADRNDTQGLSSDKPSRSTVRRKSRRSSARRKPTRPSVQRKGVGRPVMLGTFAITVVGSLWFLFTRVDEIGVGATGVLADQVVERSRFEVPSLNTMVERSSIIEGETIVLHVNGSALSSVPSTSSLLRDFSIIESQVNRSANSQSFQMRVELQPRQTGMLFIPSIYVDGIGSDVIVIDVVARK